jgi:hypothetical protein
LISIPPTIVSSSNVKGTCGILERAAVPSPALKPERRGLRSRPQRAGVWELIHSTAALVLLTGETEPNARSHRLPSILCSYRTLRHRPPNGFFRHFSTGTYHHSICSLAHLASNRPIAPRRMASPELTEVYCRTRRACSSLGRRRHFVVV